MTLTDYELERQRRLEANERRLKELGLKQVCCAANKLPVHCHCPL